MSETENEHEDKRAARRPQAPLGAYRFGPGDGSGSFHDGPKIQDSERGWNGSSESSRAEGTTGSSGPRNGKLG